MSEVVITGDEFREYQELCKERDRTLLSMQAQMKLQNAQAIELARKVVKLFDANFDMKHFRSSSDKAFMEVSGFVAVYDLANEILAQE